MVFSSLEFIYFFMPPVLVGFLVLRHMRWERGIIWWLIATSLLFYGWWNPIYLPLLLGSVLVNYTLHRVLLQTRDKAVLVAGIVFNLGLIGYFKYADFFIANANALGGLGIPLLEIALPLAISFFTFQQISFLYDTYVGRVESSDFARYLLFVVFFPQLIAGPIVMQKETVPQFTLKVFRSSLFLNLSIGVTLFAIGLFKKIVLADGIAPYANSVFDLAETVQGVPTEAAWIGALAYTFQLYFDFSGYCDMALGIARMFGIRLPVNFNSPYKARNITDFWRRWHITLSHFLRDYLYIPLGGSRQGPFRRYINLAATMLLGGLWHGAGWTFVVWGGLHGAYLVINHAWDGMKVAGHVPSLLPPLPARMLAQTLTMLAVVIAWVFFRAESFGGAIVVLRGMAGMPGPFEAKDWTSVLESSQTVWAAFVLLAGIVFLLPNAIEFTRNYKPVLRLKSVLGSMSARASEFPVWRPSGVWATAIGGLALVAVIQLYRLEDMTEFIYFNF